LKYLADTSAVHLLLPDVADQYGWQDTIGAGMVGICDITELELLYSARSAGHRARFLELLHHALPWVPVPDGIYQRAREVQQILTEHGEHRGPGAVDLLLAATAELSGLTLLHRDNDFQTIAKHTRQPTELIQR
jgi:predicted nucleic acid-binding protein